MQKKGYAPDWVLYSPKKGFHFTKTNKDLGSYNAIRVYLWAGLMAEGAMYKDELMAQLRPMAKAITRKSTPPLNTYASSGRTSGQSPIGFSAAMLPFLESAGERAAYATQRQRLMVNGSNQFTQNYYDSVLNLFGSGAFEHRYYFDTEGQLHTQWNEQCK